jgi:hypothetical protein
MELLVDAVEVVLGLRDRVRGAVEVIERVGPRRLGAVEVVELEAQLLAELADLEVAGVDQLAPALDDDAGTERVAARPDAPADAIGPLQHRRGHARLPESVRAREPREACAHDHYPCGAPHRGARRPGAEGGGNGRGAGGAEELTAGGGRVERDALHGVSKWRAGHRATLRPRWVPVRGPASELEHGGL